jgi:hypothetical protein
MADNALAIIAAVLAVGAIGALIGFLINLAAGTEADPQTQQWRRLHEQPVLRVCSGSRWPVYIRALDGHLYADGNRIADGVSLQEICQ